MCRIEVSCDECRVGIMGVCVFVRRICLLYNNDITLYIYIYASLVSLSICTESTIL